MNNSKTDLVPRQLDMQAIGVVREVDVYHDGIEEGGLFEQMIVVVGDVP